MKLPKELTTVTPLSKTLALVMFGTMPIIGFLFGMYFQQAKDQVILQSQVEVSNQSVIHCGGNIRNSTPCPDGYQCENSSGLPAGDVGGICVKN